MLTELEPVPELIPVMPPVVVAPAMEELAAAPAPLPSMRPPTPSASASTPGKAGKALPLVIAAGAVLLAMVAASIWVFTRDAAPPAPVVEYAPDESAPLEAAPVEPPAAIEPASEPAAATETGPAVPAPTPEPVTVTAPAPATPKPKPPKPDQKPAAAPSSGQNQVDKGQVFDGKAAAQTVVQGILKQGLNCMSQKNYTCAITSAENALQFDPGNVGAKSLRAEAMKAQEAALNSIEIQ